jgi:hypothetical protein
VAAPPFTGAKLEPEEVFNIGAAVEADDGQIMAFYYGSGHVASDITVICQGRDGGYSPIVASTNVLVRAPENPGEETKGILHKCDPGQYSTNDDNYDSSADISGLGSLIGASGIGLKKNTAAFPTATMTPKQVSFATPWEIGNWVEAMQQPVQYGFKGNKNKKT